MIGRGQFTINSTTSNLLAIFHTVVFLTLVKAHSIVNCKWFIGLAPAPVLLPFSDFLKNAAIERIRARPKPLLHLKYNIVSAS